MCMSLKYKRQKSEWHAGYGAGEGSIDITVYECPCGAGEVIYTKDNIPGFRESDIRIHCKICSEKYSDVTSLSNFQE